MSSRRRRLGSCALTAAAVTFASSCSVDHTRVELLVLLDARLADCETLASAVSSVWSELVDGVAVAEALGSELGPVRSLTVPRSISIRGEQIQARAIEVAKGKGEARDLLVEYHAQVSSLCEAALDPIGMTGVQFRDEIGARRSKAKEARSRLSILLPVDSAEIDLDSLSREVAQMEESVRAEIAEAEARRLEKEEAERLRAEREEARRVKEEQEQRELAMQYEAELAKMRAEAYEREVAEEERKRTSKRAAEKEAAERRSRELLQTCSQNAEWLRAYLATLESVARRSDELRCSELIAEANSLPLEGTTQPLLLELQRIKAEWVVAGQACTDLRAATEARGRANQSLREVQRYATDCYLLGVPVRP